MDGSEFERVAEQLAARCRDALAGVSADVVVWRGTDGGHPASRRGPDRPAVRAAVTAVLAAHTGTPVRRIDITRTCTRCGDARHGKPRLADPSHGVHFSAAGSGPSIAVAVGGRALGLDIELVSAVAGLPLRHVDAATRGAWSALQHGLDGLSVAETWTGVEALGKALGLGLAISADDVERALVDWTLSWFELQDAVLACLATRGQPGTVALLDLSGTEPAGPVSFVPYRALRRG